ncbi:hypothetical protein C0991_007317 [Blastosporella zonata]|nr:hypothetical protein C0991_007317 [Blastosporella zonata]
MSAIRPQPPAPSSSGMGTLGSPLSRVVSESSVPLSASEEGSGFSMFGVSLGGSRSPKGRANGGVGNGGDGVLGSPASWWASFGKDDVDEERSGARKGTGARPWQDTPKRKKTIPEEQTEGWLITREATASVLGTAADIAHEVLLNSVDLLEFAPVPGLAPAARILLQIWDSVQGVDTNRLQCLRLTERCAEILLSVREEVHEAGDDVGEELRVPVGKLIESFHTVHTFLLKQAHRPFLKRYLKRDEIQAQIQACDKALGEALGMFGLGIQIRILRTVQESERRRREEVRALVGMLEGKKDEGDGKTVGLGLEIAPTLSKEGTYSITEGTQTPGMDMSSSMATLRPGPSPMSPSPSTQPQPLEPSPSLSLSAPKIITTTTPPTTVPIPFPTTPPRSTTSPFLEPPTSPSTLRPSQILPTLRTLHTSQNAQDAKKDSEDLRALIRTALRAGSDAEMLSVLQIGREEMPEAIKTLQRALERVGEGEGRHEDGVEKAKENEEKTTERPKRWGLERVRSAVGSPGKVGRKSTDSEPKGTRSNPAPASPPPDIDGNGWARDPTLDREFIESGIDALQRMSRGAGIPPSSLPSWTITRYEITRDFRIGVGFFSDVYRGSWRGRTVAIKVLAPTTPRELFVREVGVWRALRHPGVLQLYGASSASGERPWFFVCAYMKRGSLVEFLKRVERGVEDGMEGGNRRVVFPIWESGQAQPSPGHVKRHSRSPGSVSKVEGKGAVIPKEGDLFRYMVEIAQGMEYLHANGVLHGDLKAANVLVDDDMHCVISDFGQSEMKSEAYRLSGTMPPRGTLRWQAPELMSGLSQLALTAQMDVYAYAISCVEILSMGKMPWPLADDDAVRHFVLRENKRPALPHTRFNTVLLWTLLHACWNQDPESRPSFEEVVKDVTVMRNAFLEEAVNTTGEEPPIPLSSPIRIERSRQDWDWDHSRSRPSPDMHPIPLPIMGSTPLIDSALGSHGTSPDSSATDSTFVTADEDLSTSSSSHSRRVSQQVEQHKLHSLHSHREDIVSSSSGPIRMPEPEPALYTPSVPSGVLSSSSSSRTSSLFSHTPSSRSLEDLGLGLTTPGGAGSEILGSGYESPAPHDDKVRMMRDERRYRLLLNHQFHPSLTLPLWEPSGVKLGAVGYLLKPEGKFVTLFNSLAPEKGAQGAARGLPSLYGYGRVRSGSQRQDKRNVAQRGYDAFVGHKTAHILTETTMYRYMERLEVPKKWFKSNVDAIMQIFGPTHHIQKEDLFLVIGTLDAQDYALFVSHNHPDGQAHFNVFSSPRNGQPWGTFTTDTDVPPELGGPSYDEPVPGHALSASKVSKNGSGRSWDTVLIARLRFKPDVLEPTSL